MPHATACAFVPLVSSCQYLHGTPAARVRWRVYCQHTTALHKHDDKLDQTILRLWLTKNTTHDLLEVCYCVHTVECLRTVCLPAHQSHAQSGCLVFAPDMKWPVRLFQPSCVSAAMENNILRSK